MSEGKEGGIENPPPKEEQLKEKESKEKRVPERLYRNISFEELFLIWRDKEIPLGAFPGSADSEVDAGSVGTFWFSKPINFLPTRRFYLELKTENLQDEEGVRESIMTFRVPKTYPTSLQRDDFALGRTTELKVYPGFEIKLPEFFVPERITLSNVKPFVDSYFFESVLSQHESMIQSFWFYKRPEDFIDVSYEGTSLCEYGIQTEISNLLRAEFGADFFSASFFRRQKVLRENENDFLLKNYKEWAVFERIENSEEQEIEFILINKKDLFKILDQLKEFYKWCKTLSKSSEFLPKKDELAITPILQANDVFISKEERYDIEPKDVFE